MNTFLPATDELSKHINHQADELFRRMQALDVQSLEIPEQCRWYLGVSHMNRLFFSIETSAHLLYRAIKKKGISIGETILMDYGAGVGSLYMLAKLCGCKRVIYNDHLHDWMISARTISEACNIHIDQFIVGDIEHTMGELQRDGVRCDIIASRNVIEHIYDLKKFFNIIYSFSPDTLVYSSTTANNANPASRLKHYLLHRKLEKQYKEQRLQRILKEGISGNEACKLATATRGLAMEDLTNAIKTFKQTKQVRSNREPALNTCDPSNGVWAEHILPFDEYRKLVDQTKYSISFEAGFWDTHYSKSWKNLFANTMNAIRYLGKNIALMTAPFIYVIAEPILKNSNPSKYDRH